MSPKKYGRYTAIDLRKNLKKNKNIEQTLESIKYIIKNSQINLDDEQSEEYFLIKDIEENLFPFLKANLKKIRLLTLDIFNILFSKPEYRDLININKSLNFIRIRCHFEKTDLKKKADEIYKTYTKLQHLFSKDEYQKKVINAEAKNYNHSQKLISKILSKGECSTVEFKSSLRWDYNQNQLNKNLEYNIPKAISGFLNSDGGSLIIGVDDDANILGLENDFKTLKKKNKDGFLLNLSQIIDNSIGTEFNHFWKSNMLKMNDKEICLVEVKRSTKPVFTKKKTNVEFFIRTGASTKPLNMKETYEYIELHFKNL